MFKKYQNESPTDRIIRLVLGVILAITAFAFLSGIAQIIVYVLAAIALFTGLTGFCMIYKILGISTLKKSVI